VLINYNVINLGNAEYQYDYSISNNGSLGSGVPIQLFDIFFDPTLYQGLSIVTPPAPAAPAAQWSQIILNAVGSVPADYDALALDGGIPAGTTISGFAVQFDWLGQETPGSQPFQIYDPNTFALLQSGSTSTAAPEPATLWMLGIVLAYGAWKIPGKRAYLDRRRGI
jgi:hypothetical protein